MHRIINIARNENNDNDFIEQPTADFIFLTSAKSDINLLSYLLENEGNFFKESIRALNITSLNSPIQIDNYISKTLVKTKIVILRIFGDRGTWSYGLEQMKIWNKSNKGSTLLVLSGIEDQDIPLNENSSLEIDISIQISKILRAGGKENFLNFLHCLNFLSQNKKIPKKYLNLKVYSDPYKYDWGNEKGTKIGIISYRSLYLANEVELSDKLNAYLRKNNLSPRTVFVSTLKKKVIQKELLKILKEENIKLVITTTSFNS